MSNNNNEVLIACEGVSKKFCRDFKRSLWYGIKDVSLSFSDRGDHNSVLRKDEFWAVKDINFELRRGECLGLIGHNGAGKSTLLKILNGLLTPDVGQVTMRGRVGALIELGAGFNPILTGRENVYNNAAVLGFTKAEIDAKYDAIVAFSEIGEFIESPVQNYSSGMKVRLGFAVAAQMEPDILLIDEVLAVGDLGFYFKCLNRIGELMPKSAIIFVSHSMPQVARICTEILLMHKSHCSFYSRLINEGIKRYTNSFRNSLKHQELGTGEISLKRVNINETEINHKGVVDFLNGQDLVLNFDLEINESNLDDSFIVIKICDQQLREAVNCFSHLTSGLVKPKKGILEVKVTLKQLYLNQGDHFISISVQSNKSSKLYLNSFNALAFYVDDIYCGFALSTYPGIWELNS